MGLRRSMSETLCAVQPDQPASTEELCNRPVPQRVQRSRASARTRRDEADIREHSAVIAISEASEQDCGAANYGPGEQERCKDL